MEQIRETRLDDVRVFRCRGPVQSLPPTRLPVEVVVSEGANVILDAEGKAVGWARYAVQPSPAGTGSEIVADAILDHGSEARLLAENGELGLRMTIKAVQYDENAGRREFILEPAVLMWVPRSYAHKLEPVDTDWRSLFT